MPELEKVPDKKVSDETEKQDWKFEQLKLIYDYTKMHIQLYVALISALAAAMSFGNTQSREQYMMPFLMTMICFIAAGVCAAIVATSILDVYESKLWIRGNEGAQSRQDILTTPVGIRIFKLQVRNWIKLQVISKVC